MPDPARAPRYTAAEVPGLRRDLAEWYGSPSGVQYYYQALLIGQQQIRPPGPPDRVARHLAAGEAGRLREGDLWYVDDDLCALLASAHPSMPAFAPRPSDLPSKVGFAVFAEPIAAYPAAVTRRDDVVELLAAAGGGGAELRDRADRLYADQARIVAVSWGPVDNPNWPAGGLWMSFYAASQLHFGDIIDDPDTARRARAMLPPLTVDNEAAIAWRPDGAPVDGYLLPSGDQQPGTLAWARLVFAAFQLAAQANLAETEQQRTPRPERRRTERAQLPARDVRVIRLRRGLATERDADPAADGDREWRHRWVVRGHWRNQWYPSLADHRPKWIAPYLKGPADAPLLGGDKVTVATANPPQRPAEDTAADGDR